MYKVIANGNLVSSPEFSVTNAGGSNLAICKGELVSESNDKISLIFFGDMAYYAKAHFNKGTELIVSGSLKNFSFSKKNGVTETQVLVVAEILKPDDTNFRLEEKDLSSYCKIMIDNNFSFIRKKEIYEG